MRHWILLGLTGLGLFILFFLLSFPFERLGPRAEKILSEVLSENFRGRYDCRIQAFSIALPFGIKADRVSCTERQRSFLELENLRVVFLPFRQSLTAHIQDGDLKVVLKSGLLGAPTRIETQWRNISLESVSPLLYALIRAQQPFLLFQPELSGKLFIEGSLPLKDPLRDEGSLELRIEGFRLPRQPALELIGLSELEFDEAQLSAELKRGTLEIERLRLNSEPLSAHLQGNLQLESELGLSRGDMVFQWRIARSDALMSSQFGSFLLNAPCPSPDAAGFCTRNISTLGEIAQIFAPRF